MASQMLAFAPAADAKGYVKMPNVDPLIEALQPVLDTDARLAGA